MHASVDHIQLWCFALNSHAGFTAQCGQLLSDAEQARASRFINPRDRDAFVLAHGVLRQLLARYTGMDAQALRFGEGAAGKPFLETQPAGRSALAFNLSHSRDRALLGVTAARELGVDLERHDSRVEPLAIGRRFFFGPEYEDIAAMPADLRHARFFRYWVAKEAVLKAQGVGLGFPLDSFQIRFAAADTSSPMRAVADSFDLARLDGHWRLQLPPCDPGWSAAVCAAGDDWSIQLMT